MNVVIIDNDLWCLKSLELLLKDRGHDIWTFNNPNEAISIIEPIKWSENNIPIYLVDYLMPQMNGIDFFNNTRYLSKKKFGIITGHFERVEPELQYNKMKMVSLIPKPLNFDMVYSFVEESQSL